MGWLRRNKTKKDKEKDNYNIENETEKVAASKVYIKIYRKVGKDLYALASNFEAIETNDSNTNRITINKDKFFKEDTNFSIDRIYEALRYNLDLEDKTYQEKKAVLDKEIKKQKNFLKEFETDDDEIKINLNTKYNFPDEEVKLMQLQVLKDSLKYEKLGSYVRLGKGGIRTYEFTNSDGVLYPFIFGGRFPRAHPDMTVKKKIFNQENTIFKQQTGLDSNTTLMWMLIIFVGICMVWSGLLGFWSYKNWQAGKDLDLKVNAAGINCNNVQSALVTNWGTVIDEYIDLRQEEIQILKKNENNINSNNNNIVSPANK